MWHLITDYARRASYPLGRSCSVGRFSVTRGSTGAGAITSTSHRHPAQVITPGSRKYPQEQRLKPADRKTWISFPLTLKGAVTVMGDYECKEERHDEHSDEVSHHSTNDESDERGHLPLIFFQRRVLLLDGTPNLRLLGISAVG
jgi:hypothetical protein